MRAFIAIDLPESVRAALREQQAALRRAWGDEEIRWTRPEGIHLTLKFLGEISDEKSKQVSEALANLGGFKKFSIEVKGFGFFPEARRPRVFWTGVEAPSALKDLAERVEAAMEKLGFAREQRAFSPHLTLARFNAPKPQPALQSLLHEGDFAGAPSASPSRRSGPPSLARFEVSEFFLFESKLSPQGAEYRKVERFPR